MACCNSAIARQWVAASIASLGLFTTGMFLGWPSPVASQLHQGRSPLDLTPAQLSWAVSLLYVGSLVSPMVAGVLMDRWGRRGALRATAAIAIASWLLLVCSPRVEVVYVARLLGGMWGGISYSITPAYLSEIAQPQVRGALNTVFTLMMYLGIMFEYVVGALVPYTALNLVSALVPAAFYALLAVVPESPYFHVMRGRGDLAQQALAWLRGGADVDKELRAIEESVREDMRSRGTLLDLVRTPGARRALLMAETVAFLQRNSGGSVMVAYVSTSVPAGGPVSGDQCAMAMCGLSLAFIALSTCLVDRVGRRPLLVVSCVGCGLANACLAAWFYLLEVARADLAAYTAVPYASYGLYAVFFPVGLACIPSLLQGELFPANVKGVASGLTAIVVAAVSFTSNKLYQPLGEHYGTYVNYVYFSASCVIGVVFALAVLVETRNKTLQEINYELNKLNVLTVSYELE